MNYLRAWAQYSKNKSLRIEGPEFFERNASKINQAERDPLQRGTLGEKEIWEKRMFLVNKFISTLPLCKKQLVEAVIQINVVEMFKVLIPQHYKNILRCLVKLGYLDQGYARIDKCFRLSRPADLRDKLPLKYRALYRRIYHILKEDKFSKNWYLTEKLRINNRTVKTLCKNLRLDFERFITNEVRKGSLSNLSKFDVFEILINWNGGHS
jgi:hypothetical protein